MELAFKNKSFTISILLGILIAVLLLTFSPYKVIGLGLGIVLLCSIFLRPEIGLYTIVFLVPLFPIKYTLGLLGVTFISFLINIAIGSKKLKKIPFSYSVILFILPLVFSTIFSYNLASSINYLIVFLSGSLILFLSINLIDTKQKLYYLIIMLIIAGLFVSIYGVYQYRYGATQHSSWIDKELNPDLTTRVYSTLENPNILAEYLILIIPITLSILWTSSIKTKKIMFSMIFLVQLLCLIFTFSRGGWVGFVFSIMIFALFVDRRLFLVYIVGGIGIVLLGSEVILTRISTISNVEDSSTAYRFPLMLATLDMIRDFWVTGVGLGSAAFRAVYPQYMRAGATAAHSHNIYLQHFVENGFFGIMGLLILVFNSARASFITIVNGIDRRIKAISIGAISGLFGLLLHGLVEHIFFNQKIILSFWVTIAIILVSFKQEILKSQD